MGFLNKLRRLQSEVSSIGLAGVALTVPTSRLTAEPSFADLIPENQDFSLVVTEPEIVDVARDLFVSGFYSHAVGEAFKVVDKLVASKSGLSESGVKLMRKAFAEPSPVLFWSPRTTQSQKDAHEGYGHILAGAMMGIRNPTAHEINWIDDASEALDLIVFAQHLVRKVKTASAAV